MKPVNLWDRNIPYEGYGLYYNRIYVLENSINENISDYRNKVFYSSFSDSVSISDTNHNFIWSY